MPLRVYDETIRVLKSAVSNARLGREEELGALKRLDEQARLLEHHASGPHVEELIAQERERSHLYGGRSVLGWARPLGSSGGIDPGETAKVKRKDRYLLEVGPTVRIRLAPAASLSQQ